MSIFQALALLLNPLLRRYPRRLLFLLLAILQFFVPRNTCSAQSNLELKIQQYLQAAQKAEKSKDYARCAEEYLKILKLRPEWTLIHQSLGVVYHLQSRYKEAIVAFDKALSLDANLWGSHLFLGIDYYKTNQFSKAIPALQKAFSLNPKATETEVRYWLGSSYLALGQYREAIHQLCRLSELKPRDIEVLYLLGQAYNRFSSSLFEEIGKIDPESAVAHRLQAEWYESRNDLNPASEEYKQIINLRPDMEEIHLALGKIYLRQGKYEEAIQQFENELQRAPQNETIRKHFTSALEKLMQSQKVRPGSSVLDFQQPGEVQPPQILGNTAKSDMPNTFPLHGIQAFRNNEWDKAVEALRKALELNSQDQQARLYLSRCYFAMQRYDESVQELESLLKTQDRDVELLYWYGKNYNELAALTLQKMIDLNPISYRVHQMTGELYEEKTQYSKAIESYKTALSLFPDLAGIRYTIGNVYWKMQQFDEALAWLRDELKQNPHHALANYRLGNIYLNQNRPDLAIPHLEQSVEARPQILGAHRDLGRALMLRQQFEEAIARFKIVAIGDPDDDSIHSLLASGYQRLGRLEQAEAELKIFRELNQKKLKRVQREIEKSSVSP